MGLLSRGQLRARAPTHTHTHMRFFFPLIPYYWWRTDFLSRIIAESGFKRRERALVYVYMKGALATAGVPRFFEKKTEKTRMK